MVRFFCKFMDSMQECMEIEPVYFRGTENEVLQSTTPAGGRGV